MYDFQSQKNKLHLFLGCSKMIIFDIIGALGILFIIIGMVLKSKKRELRDYFYILGGISLLTYSIYLKDLIFIILQAVFIIVAVYDLSKLKLKSKKWRQKLLYYTQEV